MVKLGLLLVLYIIGLAIIFNYYKKTLLNKYFSTGLKLISWIALIFWPVSVSMVIAAKLYTHVYQLRKRRK
jgi:hypothetical protein